MKKLSVEEQLFLLAYAGLPVNESFKKSFDQFDASLKDRIICIRMISVIILKMQKFDQIPDQDIEGVFHSPQTKKFFDSMFSGDENDLRDVELIKSLVSKLLYFTDSGKERYADFEPFLLFEHDAWLQLIIRIQKSDSVDPELKKLVEAFVKEGFGLILNPELDEFSEPEKFFPWFEKLQFNEKEKLVKDAIKLWKNYQESESYNLSGDHGEKWYKAALVFAVNITSKEYVSRMFAETFKSSYFEIYKQFKELTGLDEYEILILPSSKELEKKEKENASMLELFGRYKHKSEELAKILSEDIRADVLSEIIFAILREISEDRYDHVKKTLLVLVEQYPDCELVKKLSSVFTQKLEEKIDSGQLSYTDLPPSKLYVNNSDLYWLFIGKLFGRLILSSPFFYYLKLFI